MRGLRMGLDWNPLPRALPGNESRFAELLALLAEHGDGDADVTAELAALSQPVFETLDAPRVGIDVAADDWLRTRVDDARFADARRKMHGYYAIDLLPACDGWAFYSNYPLDQQLSRYTFRAQFLNDVKDVIGDGLHARAYQYMSADQLVRFGEELLSHARSYARENHVQAVEHSWSLDGEAAPAARRAHILFSAGKWSLYWGRRGHGLAPWF